VYADTKLVTQTPASCHMQVLPPIRQELLQGQPSERDGTRRQIEGRMAGLAYVSVFPRGAVVEKRRSANLGQTIAPLPC